MKTCPNLDCPDFVETGRAGEFVDSLVDCPLCGTTLLESPSGPTLENPGEELVRVGQVAGATAVAIAKSVLSADEIYFTTRFEGLQDLFGPGQLGSGFSVLTGPVEFWVPQSQAVEAAAILASLDEELAKSGPSEVELEDASDDGR